MKIMSYPPRITRGLAGLVLCATCLASATDGLQVGNGEWKVYTEDDGLTTTQPFRDGILPADGGLWTLLPDVTSTTINTTDVTIGGIDFGDRRAKFVSSTRMCDQSTSVSGTKTLTFAGANAFIDGSVCGIAAFTYGSLSLVHYLFDTFSNPVVVPDDVTLTLKGASVKRFANLSGAGKVVVDGGALVFQKSDDGALHGGPVEMGRASLDWKPTLASGASAQVSLPSVSASMPGTVLTVDASSGASAELTIGSLSLASAGSLILGGACGAAPGVGHRAKVRVTDASNLPIHDGVLDANVMGLADSTKDNGTRIHFLRYDGTDGFAEYVPTKSLAEAGADDIAIVGESASETLSASKQVKGLLLDENERFNRENAGAAAPTLTIPEGVVLKVGDDRNPAAVVVNSSTGYTASTTSALAGAGTIDFGSSEGFVYHGGTHESTVLNLNANLRGSNGMNFLGARLCVQFNLNSPAGWTGPTRIGSGARVLAMRADSLPSDGHVYVEDTGRGYASQLILFSSATHWYQTFHLAGFGYGNDYRHLGALMGVNIDHVFHGGIVLEADSGICYSGSSSYMGPVSGPGKLVFSTGPGKEALFTGANTSTGGFLLTDGTVSFDSSAIPGGTGKVESLPGTLLAFRHDKGRKTVVPNLFDLRGTLVCRRADVSFTGKVEAEELRLDRSDVYVKDVTVGSLVAHAASPLGAVDVDSILTIDARTDSATAVNLVNGAGTLSFVKDGKATLTLTRPQSYGGATTVKAGTLKLAGGIFNGADIAFWLDETSMVVDGNGVVTEWQSKVGDQTFAVKGASGGTTFTGPTATAEINGRRVATFSSARSAALATPLTGPRATVRSCFVVYRASSDLGESCGLLGRYKTAAGNDCGLRRQGDAWSDGSSFVKGTNYRQNGANNLGIVPGRTTVLYLRLDDEGVGNMALTADSYASSWYLLGLRSCSQGTFDGDVAEVIAFDRELSSNEAKYVENYLAKKWGVADELHAGVAEPETRVLPTTTALTVDEYATLDLNGTSATVASLAGRGRIVNTSSVPATLTVTGESAFAGHVEGNVMVSAAGDLAIDVGAGATLRATGTTTVRLRGDPLIPTNGLALWCDAYDTTSTPASKHRLNAVWASKAGRIAGLSSDSAADDLPYLDLGSGGWYDVQYINGKTRLVTTEPVSLRTVYICAQDYCTTSTSTRGGDMLLGVYGSYRGVKFNNTGDEFTVFNLPQAKAVTWNGVSGPIADNPGERLVFSYRYGGDAWTPLSGSPDGTVLGTQRLTVGYSGSGTWSYPAIYFEVIMYDREVTDEEDAQIQAYLKEKWVDPFEASGRTSKSPYIRPAPVAFNPQSSLLLANGATVNLLGAGSVALASLGGAGTVVGDVTLNGPFVVDVPAGGVVPLTTVNGNLVLGSGAMAIAKNCGQLTVGRYPALTATGTVTGDFGTKTVLNDPSGNVVWYMGEKTWGLSRSNGLSIILR